MKRRSRGRGFKSLLLHISVSGSADIAEIRSKSARVRAICAHVRTLRISLSPRIGRIWRNLSRRDLPRSADHRHTFAFSFQRSASLESGIHGIPGSPSYPSTQKTKYWECAIYCKQGAVI